MDTADQKMREYGLEALPLPNVVGDEQKTTGATPHPDNLDHSIERSVRARVKTTDVLEEKVA